MSRKLTAGDLFEVRLSDTDARYFQYVSDDSTQLGSQVVRVFRESRDVREPPDFRRIAAGIIDFHAHVFLRIGLKQGFWRKVGHAQASDDVDVLFRDSTDYGKPEIKTSRSWYVWRINGEFEDVGELSPRYQRAEIGIVVPPDSLVFRIRYGKYDFVYPDY